MVDFLRLQRAKSTCRIVAHWIPNFFGSLTVTMLGRSLTHWPEGCVRGRLVRAPSKRAPLPCLSHNGSLPYPPVRMLKTNFATQAKESLSTSRVSEYDFGRYSTIIVDTN